MGSTTCSSLVIARNSRGSRITTRGRFMSRFMSFGSCTMVFGSGMSAFSSRRFGRFSML